MGVCTVQVMQDKVLRDLRIVQDRQCTYNVTLRRFCATIVAVGKQVCVVALVIQHAMRMSHIVICGLSGCTTHIDI